MRLRPRVTRVVATKGNVHQVLIELPVAYPTHCRVIDRWGVVRVLNKKTFITEAANDE